MFYYKKHIGDYRSATNHLTLLEHGVYCCLMDTYYLNEEALPLDERQLFRIAGARTEDEKQAVLDVVNEFFKRTETHWAHSRIEFEIKTFHDKAERNRINGVKGGRPKKYDAPKPKGNPSGFDSVENKTQTDSEIKAKDKPSETLSNNPIIPLSNNPIIEDIPSDKPKKSKNVLKTLPDDFGISERVLNWANEKGYSNLELHLERFKEAAIMKVYKYADWDLAFMKAIREDWGKVNKPVYQTSGYQQPTNTRMQEIEQLRQEWELNNESNYQPY